MDVNGGVNISGDLLVPNGIKFDNSNGISYSNDNGISTISYGTKGGNKPTPCAAAPYAPVNHLFGGWVQIYDADILGNYKPGSGLLNLQAWAGGSSIDASIGGSNGVGALLLNYFCGNNTLINTGPNGGNIQMTSTGRVQIGTKKIIAGPHADYKLAVDGKIVAKSLYIIAPANGWADFVFAKDYKLSSLAEVEKYYKTYKHLPEIPSEKEITENGINVAEMNKLLLKKIEELTLYMVEQQKQIELSNKEIQKLKIATENRN